MRIDWVSLVLVVVAYGFSRASRLRLPIRYGGMAVAFALMALSRLRLGTRGLNGVLTAIVVGSAVWYGYRAYRTQNNSR